MGEDGVKAARRAEKPTRTNAQAGYRKGDETRGRILDAALQAFGDAGFRAATTRQIADRASVTLPALQYYFGDKEGLYRACAETIASRFQAITADLATNAVTALKMGCPAEVAREHLRVILGALARFLAGSGEAEGWARFVAGELQDHGPAFDILYERLWRPGGELTAALVGRTIGRSARDPEVGLRTQFLISSLLAFQGGRKQLTLRALGWSRISDVELAQIVAVLNTLIDAITSGGDDPEAAPDSDNQMA